VSFRTNRPGPDVLTDFVARWCCRSCVRVLLPQFDPVKWAAYVQEHEKEYEWVGKGSVRSKTTPIVFGPPAT
jgi:hypothetical protein